MGQRSSITRETAFETDNDITKEVQVLWPLPAGNGLVPSTESKQGAAAQAILEAKSCANEPLQVDT